MIHLRQSIVKCSALGGSFIITVLGCSTQEDTPNSALQTPHSVVQFTDVTSEAGIQFRHVHGGSGEKFTVETMGSGAAFLDYDNDGDQDLYVVNGSILPGFVYKEIPRNILYRNEGDGTFTDRTDKAKVGDTGYGMGVAVADFDNDGYPDLYLANFDTNRLYRNKGDGTFTEVTANAGVGDNRWGASAAFADIDADGDLDLYVTNFLHYTLDENKNCFDKRRGARIYCGPLHYDGVSDILYRNNGNGTFTDVTKEAGVENPEGKGLGVVFLDYDNDGDVDIYVANDSARNFLYRNDGKGRFTDVTFQSGTGYSEDGVIQAGMGTDAGDYDNDGDIDLIVTNFSFDVNTLYQNMGNGVFEDVSFQAGLGEPSFPNVGWGVNFLDYDNDGDQDLFVANGHSLYILKERIEEESTAQSDLLFENHGDGSFSNVSMRSGDYFQKAMVGRGSILGDYDNDGDLDLFVSNNNQEAYLLRNDGGSQNNWLIIKTIGTKSNRDGIGARITVFSGDLSQVDEIRSGTSYLSQNESRIHFGLGKREIVNRLEIRWPSGLVEFYREIGVNQFITVTEGKGFEKGITF
jgi:hypothetical protein